MFDDYILPNFTGRLFLPVGYLGIFQVSIDNLNVNKDNFYGGSNGLFSKFNLRDFLEGGKNAKKNH